MQKQKKKAFAYRIYSHFTQQCMYIILSSILMKKMYVYSSKWQHQTCYAASYKDSGLIHLIKKKSFTSLEQEIDEWMDEWVSEHAWKKDEGKTNLYSKWCRLGSHENCFIAAGCFIDTLWEEIY